MTDNFDRNDYPINHDGTIYWVDNTAKNNSDIHVINKEGFIKAIEDMSMLELKELIETLETRLAAKRVKEWTEEDDND